MQTTEELVAGRELDALVAEKVMGQTVREDRLDTHPDVVTCRWISDTEMLPGYSTDIAAAWQVVEKLHADWSFDCGDDALSGQWNAQFLKIVEGPRPSGYGRAETAPLAICRAALTAVSRP